MGSVEYEVENVECAMGTLECRTKSIDCHEVPVMPRKSIRNFAFIPPKIKCFAVPPGNMTKQKKKKNKENQHEAYGSFQKKICFTVFGMDTAKPQGCQRLNGLKTSIFRETSSKFGKSTFKIDVFPNVFLPAWRGVISRL